MLPIYELAKAVKNDDIEGVVQAINDGADPNGVDLSRHSMLSLAESNHANNVVPLLIKSGCNPYERIGHAEDGLLHRAARHENIGFAIAFLGEGASPNTRNANGQTPLHIVASKGLGFFTRLLLDHKASVLIKDCKGRAPLSLALLAGNTEIVSMLRRREETELSQSTYTQGTHSPLSMADVQLAMTREYHDSFRDRLAHRSSESSITP